MTSANPIQKKSIRFRARSFVAFALAPEKPFGNWLAGLDRWTENSPGFFTGRPVVLDLNGLKPNVGDIAGIVMALAERAIRVYAIELADVEALPAELPPLLVGAKPAAIRELPALAEEKSKPQPAPEPPRPASALIIDQPVRSGQSIFHAEGDVVVLGSVGSGSEIIAAGSIHVYGTLRGRAFAGALGNSGARIFCRRNEAELLAIDGWYRTADDMEPSARGKPVQAFFDNGVIWVKPLE